MFFNFNRTSVLSAMEWLLNHETDEDIDDPVQLVEDLHVSPIDKDIEVYLIFFFLLLTSLIKMRQPQ